MNDLQTHNTSNVWNILTDFCKRVQDATNARPDAKE